MGITLVPADSSIFKRGGVANRVLCLVLAVALVATMTVLPTGKAEAATTTIKIPVTYGQTEARSMLQMINDFRASEDAWYWNSDDTTKTTLTDLQPLAYDYALEQSAMLRAAEIAVSFSHTRPNGESWTTAMQERPLYVWGENIAAGGGYLGSKTAIFNSWREDDEKYAGQGHRRNMLETRLTSVGIGYVQYEGIGFWVQNFGNPNSGAPATTADNSKRVVSIEVDQAAVTSKKLAASYATSSLQVGATKTLPTLTMTLGISGCWPYGTLKTDTSGVVWTSSKPSVAYVSGGKIVAKAAGTAQLTASLDGVKATVKVTVSAKKPAATSLKSVKAGKKKATIKWKKQTKNVSGYQVYLSTNRKFNKNLIKKTVSKKKTSLTVKKLKAKKTYYVKIRTYYQNPTTKKKTYSGWSKVKKVTIKK